jgi:hypothetical protein
MPRIAGSEPRAYELASVEPDDAVAPPTVRALMPLDGSIVQSGGNASVFCATCERWIDCCEGVPAVVAWTRHGNLFH